MHSADLIWTFVSLFLTLLVFSFIVGDNPLFRITSYIFIGVTAGFVAVLLIYQVIIPRLIIPALFDSSGNRFLAFIPLILSLLLLGKLFPRYSNLGNISMGFLVGVGAAVMIGGAINGTIIQQSRAVINNVTIYTSDQTSEVTIGKIIESLILLIGTLSALVYFQFSAKKMSGGENKRSKAVEAISKIGGIFIAITFGALYAGVYSAALTALIERLDYILQTIGKFISF